MAPRLRYEAATLASTHLIEAVNQTRSRKYRSDPSLLDGGWLR